MMIHTGSIHVGQIETTSERTPNRGGYQSNRRGTRVRGLPGATLLPWPHQQYLDLRNCSWRLLL